MREKKGFTLVELIVTMGILAVIAAVTVPTLTKFVDEGRAKECCATREAVAARFVADQLVKKDLTLDACIAQAQDLQCPCGGNYTAEGNKIRCDYPGHGTEVVSSSGNKDGWNVDVTQNSGAEIETNAPEEETPAPETEATVVNVSAQNLTLYEEESGTLSAVVTVNGKVDSSVTVLWNGSSNENVASVDLAGNVTALTPGTCTVTAAATKNGVTGTVTVTITVLQKTTGENELLQNVPSPLLVLKNNTDLSQYIKQTGGKWYSSDNNIAGFSTPESTTLIGRNLGFVTLTYTYGDQSEQMAVRVVDPVNDLSIQNYGDIQANGIRVGETYQFTMAIAPSDTTDAVYVNWSSSNTSVVSVDNQGLITAHTTGDATITLSCYREYYQDYIVKTYNVHVYPKRVTQMSLNPNSEQQMQQGEQLVFTVDVQPTDATGYTLSWWSDNSSVASVDETGIVTAHASGNTQIHCKLYQQSAQTVEYQAQVSVKVQ